jgi:hypothetical protein
MAWQDIIEQYKDLLITQYRNKDKARGMVGTLTNCSVCEGLPLQLRDAFILDSAAGDQLDILGKIVGVPRNIIGLDLSHSFFSLTRYSGTPASIGFNRSRFQQDTRNLNQLLNGDVETWSGGASAAPDSWTLQGAGATIARESTIIRSGTYSAKLTRAGTDCNLYQAFSATLGISYWKSRTITFGCWVSATVANRARIFISDSVGSSYSSFHTGSGAWEWLTITRAISSSATDQINAGFSIGTGNTSAYFDGAILVGDLELINGSFDLWSSGLSSAPDAWSLTGSGATIARERTLTKAGPYVAKVTRVGSNCFLRQNLHNSRGINYWKGRTVALGSWVCSDTPGVARIRIEDSVNSYYSDYHSGSGEYEFLKVSASISTSATDFSARLNIDNTNASAYFGGVVFTEGSDIESDLSIPLTINQYDINPYTNDLFLRYNESANYVLSDFELKTLIRLKIVYNSRYATFKAIKEGLWNMFKGDIDIVTSSDTADTWFNFTRYSSTSSHGFSRYSGFSDDGYYFYRYRNYKNMEVSYVVKNKYMNAFEGGLYLNIIPDAMGVAINKTYT